MFRIEYSWREDDSAYHTYGAAVLDLLAYLEILAARRWDVRWPIDGGPGARLSGVAYRDGERRTLRIVEVPE